MRNPTTPRTTCWLRLNADEASRSVQVDGKDFKTDSWTNVPQPIIDSTSQQLHLKPHHPLTITRRLIESRFPDFKYHNKLPRAVTTYENFDSLDFPADHPGRSRTDTYYLNKDNVLRTHTSAHEAEIFRANLSQGYLISADVYRRDAIDHTHYPIFHQMEGAMMWDRKNHGGNVAKAVQASLKTIPAHDMIVEDPYPTVHPERNPLQPEHTMEETEAIATHLKRSIEHWVVLIFNKAKEAAAASGDPTAANAEPLQVRWVEAYFPFTSPSWELEIFWQDEWLEVLGCGVTLQKILKNADVPAQRGWAFGIGLERIAMLLFNIPDIRLFWSKDKRFLSQFSDDKPIQRFVPFSKHPPCYKDVSFWIRSGGSSAGGGGTSQDFHENDVMEIVRNRAGDLVEDVRLVDEFTHPKTRRRSVCYRINYRSLERTLTNAEVNDMHAGIIDAFVKDLGVEIR